MANPYCFDCSKEEITGEFYVRKYNDTFNTYKFYKNRYGDEYGKIATTNLVNSIIGNAKYRVICKDKKGYHFKFENEKIYLSDIKWINGCTYDKVIQTLYYTCNLLQCKGELIEEIIDQEVKINDEVVIINNIPRLRCKKCNDYQYTNESKKIIKRNLKKLGYDINI